MYGILNDLILIWLRNFRVPDPDATGTFPFYLSIFEIIYKKKNLKSVKKKNLPTTATGICHFLFHTAVLQYSITVQNLQALKL